MAKILKKWKMSKYSSAISDIIYSNSRHNYHCGEIPGLTILSIFVAK
jgi:hypothetical protein